MFVDCRIWPALRAILFFYGADQQPQVGQMYSFRLLMNLQPGESAGSRFAKAVVAVAANMAATNTVVCVNFVMAILLSPCLQNITRCAALKTSTSDTLAFGAGQYGH